MKIMVTGAGALLGQGIIKSLRLAESRYRIVAADPDPRAVGLFWADASYLVPTAISPNYLDVVRSILDQERPDALLIGTDVELEILALHKEDIEAVSGTRVIVSPPGVIRIADDKWRTHEFLTSHGFPSPESALPPSADELLERCGFPLVVKPRIGARSVGVSTVHTRAELQAAIASTKDPVIQECVGTPADEYTSGVTVIDGEVKAVVTMRRDLRDGNTYRAYVEPGSPYNSLLADVALAVGGWGPLNFQFRVDAGTAKIFEINARFSGTTPLRAQAGYNEVDWLLRHVLRGEPIPAPVLRRMVILRYWDEIVVAPEELERISMRGFARMMHGEQSIVL